MSFRQSSKQEIKSKILSAVTAGATKQLAASIGGIHRVTLQRWIKADHDFAIKFNQAWERGKKKRQYTLWLNHPFRGKRPPSSKRTRDFPRFRI